MKYIEDVGFYFDEKYHSGVLRAQGFSRKTLDKYPQIAEIHFINLLIKRLIWIIA